jgi:hypothetical protein
MILLKEIKNCRLRVVIYDNCSVSIKLGGLDSRKPIEIEMSRSVETNFCFDSDDLAEHSLNVLISAQQKYSNLIRITKEISLQIS